MRWLVSAIFPNIINKTKVIKQEPNQQETEQAAQCFLSCFDKHHFPALV